MTDTLLRAARHLDLPAIHAIYAHAVETGTASYELTPPDLEEMENRFRALREKQYPYLVAEGGDGSIMGYAYVGAFRARPAYRFIVEDSIYVAPGVGGKGIGRKLLARLITESEALGFRQMIAIIGDRATNAASIGLHTALGFRHAGVIEGSGFKHGRWLDTAFMQRALNEGAKTPPETGAFPDRFL